MCRLRNSYYCTVISLILIICCSENFAQQTPKNLDTNIGQFSNGKSQHHKVINPSKVVVNYSSNNEINDKVSQVHNEVIKEEDEKKEGGQLTDAKMIKIIKPTIALDSSTETLRSSSSINIVNNNNNNNKNKNHKNYSQSSDYHKNVSTLTVTATRIGMSRYFKSENLSDNNYNGQVLDENDDRSVTKDSNYVYPTLINKRTLNITLDELPSSTTPIITLDSSEYALLHPLIPFSSSSPQNNQQDLNSYPINDNSHEENEGEEQEDDGFYDYELDSQVTTPYHHQFQNPIENEENQAMLHNLHNSDSRNQSHFVTEHDEQSQSTVSPLAIENKTSTMAIQGDTSRTNVNNVTSVLSLKKVDTINNADFGKDQTRVSGDYKEFTISSALNNLFQLISEPNILTNVQNNNNSSKKLFFEPTIMDDSPIPTYPAREALTSSSYNDGLKSSEENTAENDYDTEILPSPVALVSSTLHETVDDFNDNITSTSSTLVEKEGEDDDPKVLEDDFAEAFRKNRPSANSRRIRIGNGDSAGDKKNKRTDKRVRMRIRKVNKANFSSAFGDPTVFPSLSPQYHDNRNGIETDGLSISKNINKNMNEDSKTETKPPRMKRLRSTTTTSTTTTTSPPIFFQNSFNTMYNHDFNDQNFNSDNEPLPTIPSSLSPSLATTKIMPTSSKVKPIKFSMSRNDISSSSLSSPIPPIETNPTKNTLTVPQQIENPSKSSYTEKSNFVIVTTTTPTIDKHQKSRPENDKIHKNNRSSIIDSSTKEWLQTAHSNDVHHHQHPDDSTNDHKILQDRTSWEDNYMNLQQNSFYNSGEEIEDTKGGGQSLVEINHNNGENTHNHNINNNNKMNFHENIEHHHSYLDDTEFENEGNDNGRETHNNNNNNNHHNLHNIHEFPDRTNSYSYPTIMNNDENINNNYNNSIITLSESSQDHQSHHPQLQQQQFDLPPFNKFPSESSSSTSSNGNEFRINTHLKVIPPNHIEAQKYFEQLAPGYKFNMDDFAQVENKLSKMQNQQQQQTTSSSSHFDRTKFKFDNLQSSELPPFEVERVVDDESILQYHNANANGNNIKTYKNPIIDVKELEPIVIHHHHTEIIHPPTTTMSEDSPVSISQDKSKPLIMDHNSNFHSTVLNIFEDNNDNSNNQNPQYSPFAQKNLNSIQTHGNLPTSHNNMIKEFHPFPNSSPKDNSANVISPNHIENGGFHPLPPFTQFPTQSSSNPSSYEHTQQNRFNINNNHPTSYNYYSKSHSKNKQQIGPQLYKNGIMSMSSNSNGKRGPISAIITSSDGSSPDASASITLPMPGLVNVPIPPSDALGLQQVTPHRHFPPHSHSMSSLNDYEPANPPLPNGHHLQYHFDPFIQNAGQFPNENNIDNNQLDNQNLSPSSGSHLDKFRDFNQIAQGAQSNNYAGGPGGRNQYYQPEQRPNRHNPPPTNYPSTRYQGSTYFNEQHNNGQGRDRPLNKYNFHDHGFIDDEEEQQQQPQYNDVDHDEDEEEHDHANNYEQNNQYNSGRPKPNTKYQHEGDNEDPYETYDKNPNKENTASSSSNEKSKGEGKSPYSETPYVLMFPSLVPEEAMIPVRPKIQGREVPVIPAADHNPVPTIPTQSLAPGMEVVHVHPREQMMNVLAAKYHDDMMSKYIENKKKPPPNIYTPYGVLVPMGEVGSSPSSSTRTNKFLRQADAFKSQESKGRGTKGIGFGLSKYTPLGEFQAHKNIYLDGEETGNKDSGDLGLQSTMKPAIDLLADKLAVKLSALGYILKHPPKHLAFHVSTDPDSSSTDQDSISYTDHSNSNTKPHSSQQSSGSSPSSSSLSTKTTTLNKSITSKGIPKTEFRKYVKELLKEKLQDMLVEIEQNEKKDSGKNNNKASYSKNNNYNSNQSKKKQLNSQYPTNRKQSSSSILNSRPKQFAALQGQYSNNIPVVVPPGNQIRSQLRKAPSPIISDDSSKMKGKIEENPNSNSKSSGGIFQSIKNFFSFGKNRNAQQKVDKQSPLPPPHFFMNRTNMKSGFINHPHRPAQIKPSTLSSPWVGNKRRKDIKPHSNVKRHPPPHRKPNHQVSVGSPRLNMSPPSSETNQINTANNSRNSFKEVQALVHLLLKSGIEEDDDGGEIVSMEALLQGLDGNNKTMSSSNVNNENNYGDLISKRIRSEEIQSNIQQFNEAFMNNNLISSDSILKSQPSNHNHSPLSSSSFSSTGVGSEGIRIVKPFTKEIKSEINLNPVMTKLDDDEEPLDWKPVPEFNIS